MKQITFKQYKAIDISILSVLLLVFEALSIYASGKWFSHSGISLVPLISLTPLVVVIMMMRWSEFAFVPALVGGLSYCFACGGKPEQYLIYCLGNLFGLLSLLIIKKLGKDTVRQRTLYLVLIPVSTYLFITVGRWLVSLIFEPTVKTLLTFITTDIISLVVAIVGVIALRKSDGILEDQKSYLLRLDRERKALEEERIAMASGAYLPGQNDVRDEDEDDDIIWDDTGAGEDEFFDEESEDFAADIPADEEFTGDTTDEPDQENERIPETEYIPEAEEMPVYSPAEEQESQIMNENNNDEFYSEDKI